ncbi:MAG: D-cysteine desulfhydrase family protein [Phycisphaerae bacterium]|nr:D-cysteine desulfhydrase family protein [Phycisphaerae bacterium]
MHPKEPKRHELAQLPTPVVELKHLAAELGLPRLLVKRDDLTGFETSGNKVRKLEYVIADAIAQGADTLVTCGGFQSNHCRATAALGARLGLRVRLFLRSTEPHPANVGNLLLDRLFGADVSFHEPIEYNQHRKNLVEKIMAAEQAAGRKPYYFGTGASIPLGCWGYIRCFEELTRQLGPATRVDLFCTVGSGGTMTGLILGKALSCCENWRVIGVPICDDIDFWRADLRKLERETVAAYRLGLDESACPIELIDGFIGEGYAIPYPEEVETIRQIARLEGLVLDPTYTGKAMTGMLATIRAGGLRKDALPVFLHTGGAFGTLARSDLF